MLVKKKRDWWLWLIIFFILCKFSFYLRDTYDRKMYFHVAGLRSTAESLSQFALLWAANCGAFRCCLHRKQNEENPALFFFWFFCGSVQHCWNERRLLNHIGGMREHERGAFWCRGWIISAGLERPQCAFDHTAAAFKPVSGWHLNIWGIQIKKRSSKNSSTLNKPFSGAVANIFSFFFYFFPQIFFSAEIWVFLIETLRSLDINISSDGCSYCFLQSNNNPPKCCCLLCSSFYLSAHRVGSSRCKVFFLFCICTRCVTKMWEWNGALSQHRWDYTYCMLLFPDSRLQSFFLTSLVGFSLPVFVFP